MFDDFQTAAFSILNGLDLFLGICYLIYNADLLKIPDIHLKMLFVWFMMFCIFLWASLRSFPVIMITASLMNKSIDSPLFAKLHNCKFRIK